MKLIALSLRARDVAVALEAADHLVHGRRRELHRAGDVGAGHRQPRLLQPEQRLQVLLLGDGRVLGRHLRSILSATATRPREVARSIAAVQIGSGTRAFVTGASRGIGRALAHELADARRDRRPRRALGERARGARRASCRAPTTCSSATSRCASRCRAAVEDFVAADGRHRPARRQRRHHALRADRDAARREDRADDRGQLARHGLHGQGGAAAPARRAAAATSSSCPPARAARRSRGAAAYCGDEGRAADVRRGAAPRARRHRRLADDRLPGRDRDVAARPRERAQMPAWYRGGPSAGAGRGARRADRRGRRARRRAPALDRRSVRAWACCTGCPAARGRDALLRRLRGGSAAPRRD